MICLLPEKNNEYICKVYSGIQNRILDIDCDEYINGLQEMSFYTNIVKNIHVLCNVLIRYMYVKEGTVRRCHIKMYIIIRIFMNWQDNAVHPKSHVLHNNVLLKLK